MRCTKKFNLDNKRKNKQSSKKGGNLMIINENKLNNEIAENIATEEDISIHIDELLKNNQLLINELANYTRKLIRKYNHLLKDSDPMDYVNVAFEKLLTGERVWDKSKYPDIMNLLRRIIWSCIMNEVSYKVKKVDSNDGGQIPRFESIYYTDENGESVVVDIIDDNQDIEFEIHKRILFQNIFDELEKKQDDEAYLVLDQILEGFTNKEIAANLGIDLNKVVNARKRIINIGKKLIN